MADDFEAKEEVTGHAADDGQLLEIFLAEDGGVRSGQMEKFGHHGADAAEVAGAPGSAQSAREHGFVDEGRVAGRIHFRHGGREYGVHVVRGAQTQVGVERTWILGQIFVGAELGRVDEDADDHRSASACATPGGIDQGGMAVVQRAHGRNEDNGRGGAGPKSGEFRQCGEGAHGLRLVVSCRPAQLRELRSPPRRLLRPPPVRW